MSVFVCLPACLMFYCLNHWTLELRAVPNVTYIIDWPSPTFFTHFLHLQKESYAFKYGKVCIPLIPVGLQENDFLLKVYANSRFNFLRRDYVLYFVFIDSYKIISSNERNAKRTSWPFPPVPPSLSLSARIPSHGSVYFANFLSFRSYAPYATVGACIGLWGDHLSRHLYGAVSPVVLSLERKYTTE